MGWLLVVVDRMNDIPDVLSAYQVTEVLKTRFESRGKYLNYEGKEEEILIAHCDNLETSICGYVFNQVLFWEGNYESDEIMYALSRVRSIT